MPHLLIELGCEELPARLLQNLETTFANSLCETLVANRFTVKSKQLFSTPRRLAALVELTSDLQKTTTIVKKGPKTNISYDEQGNPTKACLGFLRANNIAVADLENIMDGGNEHIAISITLENKPILEIIGSLLEQTLKIMPLPATMRWKTLNGKALQFVRPIVWVSCMLDDKVAENQSLWGLPLLGHSYGHRVKHNGDVNLPHATAYEAALAEAFVIANSKKRQQKILNEINSVANKHNLSVIMQPKLLEEVTALVEYPCVICAEFNNSYLQLPKEVITTTLTKNQKYFCSLDQNTNQLSTKFLIIANLPDTNNNIAKGNERVVVPRLDDAQFFVKQDTKTSLITMSQNLKNRQNIKSLGNMQDKKVRLSIIANWCNEQANKNIDSALIDKVADLCKADLLSEIVGEFPELQGIAGRFYATEQAENTLVSTAIETHYKPINTEDSLPQDSLGWLIAVADRVDILVGLFATDNIPAGDKDPFALRRAMNGLIRLLGTSDINLQDLFACAYQAYIKQNIALTNQNYWVDLQAFCFNRLPHIYAKYGDLLVAILNKSPKTLADILLKSEALMQFIDSSDASNYEQLLQTNKRLHNILKNVDTKTLPNIDTSLFIETIEQTLFEKIQLLTTSQKTQLDNKNYLNILSDLTGLSGEIHNMFENVLINTDDPKCTNNRLALLTSAFNVCNSVAQLNQLPLVGNK